MNTLNRDTENEMARLGVKKVFIIGGTGVVSDSVLNDIKSKNIECVRLCGNNRFDTAIEVAKRSTAYILFRKTSDNSFSVIMPQSIFFELKKRRSISNFSIILSLERTVESFTVLT